MDEDLKRCCKCEIEKMKTDFILETIHRNIEINVEFVLK